MDQRMVRKNPGRSVARDGKFRKRFSTVYYIE